VIVALVDQRYLDVTSLGECSSTSQAGEATAYDYDVRFSTLWIQGMTSSLVGLTIAGSLDRDILGCYFVAVKGMPI
jgi:hypothetical protein